MYMYIHYMYILYIICKICVYIYIYSTVERARVESQERLAKLLNDVAAAGYEYIFE